MKSRMTHSVRLAAAAFIAVLAITLTPAVPAQAHTSGWWPESLKHTWCFGPTTRNKPALRTAIEYAMDRLRTQTVMEPPQQPSECTGSVDVLWAEGDWIAPSRGRWECLGYDYSSATCYNARLIINISQIGSSSGPYDANLRKTTCHELGHSAGVQHHDKPYNDCMVRGAISAGHQSLNDVHVQNINRHW